MSFLDELKQRRDALLADLNRTVKRFANRQFGEGFIAAAARLTKADGNVLPAEKTAVVKLLKEHPALEGLPVAERLTKFEEYLQQAGDIIGDEILNDKIAAVGRNKEAANTLVRLVVALANSDGDFADSEKIVVRDICRILGIDPVV